jgi:hydroxyacylglutathione hydrolase
MKEALYKGAAVLDTRLWEQYAAGHLMGALHAPMENNFPTVAGSYVEENIPIYLLIEENRVKEAVIDLIRIGLDNIAGYVTPEAFEEYVAKGGEVQKTKYFNIKDLQNTKLEDDALVLDVRRADEFDAGHLPEAQNIAHTRLLTRLDELPKDRPIYVHCRTSNRSAYASGLLDSKGYNVTLLIDGYEAWAEAGGDVVVEAPQLV